MGEKGGVGDGREGWSRRWERRVELIYSMKASL